MTSVDFNLTNSNNLSQMDNKDSSINKMSSFKALNDRDENFDSSLNSAFLKNVNLNGTDESKDDLKSS